MTIAIGDRLPDATLRFMGENGPSEVTVSDLTTGKSVVLFGLPGAFTGTCTTAHLPSFIRTKDAFASKGIDDVICVSVNDVFVMQEWAKSTGADSAGITMLCDTDSSFAKALGLDFDAPPVGLLGRMKRFAMVVKDGEVTVLNIEENPGVCELSAGETILDAI